MNEQPGLMAAPIMTKGQSEMITFRKSIDTRPSRSVLSSPRPLANNKDMGDKLKDKPLKFLNKHIDTSAVDSYSPILNQTNKEDDGTMAPVSISKNVDFFDDDDSDYTNSIYQTIMNTENKHWFQRPATYEIPQTKLSSNNEDDFMGDDSWRDELKAYLNNVNDLIEEYERIKDEDIKNIADDVEISVSEANVLEAFKDDKFNLKDMYYKNKLKSFSNNDDQVLLRKLKGMLSKIENIHKDYISSHVNEIQSIYKDILDVKKQLLAYENLIQEEMNKNNKTLQQDIIKEETHLNMKLKLNNIQRLENELVSIDSLIDKITALCDKYHLECEENENLLSFENLEKYLKEINDLDGELDKNVLFEKVPLLKDKREILLNLKLEVGGKLRLQFVKILESDLESYHDNHFKNPSTILKIMDADADWPDLKFDPSFKQQLNGYVDNLSRNNLLITAYKMYCDRIINKCRELVKDSLPKPKEDESAVVKMSQLIVNMTPLEFNNLVDYVLSTSLIYFKRLYEQQKLLLDLGINALDKNPSMQNEALDSSYLLKLDIRAGINESIRIVQLRMAKIITCRSSINARLNYRNFLKLRLAMCNFSRQCEQLTGEILTVNLNDVIVVHTEEYQKLLCERLNKRIRTFVEQREDWLPTIVTDDVQRSVNEIFLSNKIIPDDWYITMTTVLDNKTNATGDKKSIVINEKTYVSSVTLIEVIKIIKEVLIVSNNLPVKYMQSLEYGLLKILADFDRISLRSLISNPSILNTNTLGSATNGNNTQNNTFFVNLNNNHNININSIIFKDNEKNYTILSETLECIKEIIPKIKAYFNGKAKNTGTKMVNNTKMIVNPNQGRLKTNKFYDNIMINYDRTAGLIFRSNIPPPSEDTPDESLTKVAQRKSLDENKDIVESTNPDVKQKEVSNEIENTETKEKIDKKEEQGVEQKEKQVEDFSEDVKLEEKNDV